MEFPIHIHKISMGLPILYLKKSQEMFLNYGVILSLNVVLILANSTDPDQGLHCLPTHPFRSFQYTEG